MVSLGLSLMPEAQFAAASLPLFEQGIIETLEWSFDMGWGRDGVPPWVDELLGHYGETDDLNGHGVSFSVMSGEFTPHHHWWLERLADEVQTRRYHRISEHMGFIGAGRFSFAAPLPVPFHPDIVALGQDRMRLLAETAGCPVGLENLATSLGPDDGSKQGDLLDAVLDPVDGFLVLDLHNLWCQSINLGLAVDMLLGSYPLHRVAEIHVSGGSWDQRSGRRIRRDTHDDLVPAEVLALLPLAAPHCPNLETVVYERLGPSLIDPASHGPYRDDVIKVADIVANLTNANLTAANLTTGLATRNSPMSNELPDLAAYQAGLLELLHRDEPVTEQGVREAAGPYADALGNLDPTLLDVAATLTKTWGKIDPAS